MGRFSWWCLLGFAIWCASPDLAIARGTRQGRATPKALRAHTASPSDRDYRSALLIEKETGRVLFERNADEPWPPASMVKMMTALVAFEAVREGRVRLDQPVVISSNASRTPGSRVGLRAGSVYRLGDLLGAMLVASANDASVAVAEAVAGSVEGMVRRMNERARVLGMQGTRYGSVNGLPGPDGEPLDYSTARDQARLACQLVEFPEILALSSRPVAPFGRRLLRNTNHLVGQMPGVDGLKTGYFRAAGFNLTATAHRDGMRLVSVVLGCRTLGCRFAVTRQLLEWAFAHYAKLDLIRAGEPLAVEVRVANGAAPVLRPVAGETSTYLLRREEVRNLEVRFQLPSVVPAPVARNQPLGEIVIHEGEEVLDVIPALSPTDIDRAPEPRVAH
jgi:D-alanyl-D-alanine carboxypeptidase (penicillin-binding protein 5/6)